MQINIFLFFKKETITTWNKDFIIIIKKIHHLKQSFFFIKKITTWISWSSLPKKKTTQFCQEIKGTGHHSLQQTDRHFPKFPVLN